MILSLSGGGLNGLVYLGMFRYLESRGLTPSQFKIYGTSIGALFGTLWAMGFSAEHLIISFSKNQIFPSANIENFITNGGLDDGRVLEKVLRNIIREKFDENISLQSFKNVYICTTNISTKEIVYLSHEKYPNIPVHLAIRMSCSIPFVFEPVHFENELYLDGATLENIPMPLLFEEPILFCKFDVFNNHKTIDDEDSSCNKNKFQAETNQNEEKSAAKNSKSENEKMLFDTSRYYKSIYSVVHLDKFHLLENFLPQIYKKYKIAVLPKPFQTIDFKLDIQEKNKQIMNGYKFLKKNGEIFDFICTHVCSEPST
jgi:predicted acylesterase/phospholipase RssA